MILEGIEWEFGSASVVVAALLLLCFFVDEKREAFNVNAQDFFSLS